MKVVLVFISAFVALAVAKVDWSVEQCDMLREQQLQIIQLMNNTGAKGQLWVTSVQCIINEHCRYTASFGPLIKDPPCPKCECPPPSDLEV